MKIDLQRTIVVDDNLEDFMIISRLLKKLHDGIEIDYAECGMDALDKLRDECHCIAFFDFRLPDMSGVDLLESIRRKGCNVPVVMVTGQDDVKTAVSAMKSGAYDFLCKDELTSDLLAKVVLNTMEKRRLEEENDRLRKELQNYTRNLEEIVKERTEELRYLSDYQELILSNLNDYIRVVDPVKNVILYESPKIVNEFGSGVGGRCYAFWNSDNRCENCLSLKALESGSVYSEERETDGKVYHVTFIPLRNMDGSMSSIEVVTDVTEKKRLERERRRQREEMSRRMREVILNQQVLLELAEMNYSDLDRGLRRITETTARRLGVERVSVWFFNEDWTEISCEDLYILSRNVHDREGVVTLRAEDHPRYFQALKENRVIAANNAETDPRTKEFTEDYLRPLGIVSMMDAPIRFGGEVVGVICSEHVGRMRKWTMEEMDFATSIADMVSLAMAATEIDRSKRLAAIGEAVSRVAHDIRNPLSFIKAGAELLEESDNLAVEDQKFMKWITAGVTELEGLVESVLDFSKSRELKLESVDLNSLIDDVTEAAGTTVDASRVIRFNKELPEEPVVCLMDEVRLRSILKNLLSNSMQAVKEEGEITISCSLNKENNTVEIKVADNGEGITRKDMENIFDPFFTTKPKGTGLGMSIIKKFVEMHGGTIKVSSDVGRGTEVTISIPMKKPA